MPPIDLRPAERALLGPAQLVPIRPDRQLPVDAADQSRSAVRHTAVETPRPAEGQRVDVHLPIMADLDGYGPR